MKKELEKIAQELIVLEKEMQEGNNIPQNFKKMESLTKKLTFDEIVEMSNYLDEYMMKNQEK